MRRWAIGWAVVLAFAGTARAEDAPGALSEKDALIAALALTRAVADKSPDDALTASLDLNDLLAGFGKDFERMEKPEREETVLALRASIAAELRRALATKPPTRVARFDVKRLDASRVAVAIRVEEGGKPVGGERLTFARRNGRVVLVELGVDEYSLGSRMREAYRTSRMDVLWAPLALIWKFALPGVLAKAIPKPLWRAPMAAPHPVWMSRETLSLGIEAPVIPGAAIDPPLDAASPDRWLSVVLSANGTLSFRPGGRYGPLRAYKLGLQIPGQPDGALQALVDDLADATAGPTLRFRDGASRYRLVVYADRRAESKYVQWLLQAFSHPSVKGYAISFSVRRTTEEGSSPYGRIDVQLPRGGSLLPQPTATVRIKAFRRDMLDPEKAYTIAKVGQSKVLFALPKAWRGRTHETAERIEKYDATLRQLRRRVEQDILAQGGVAASARAEVVAVPPKGRAVPHEDMMQLVQVSRGLGVKELVYEVPAPPLVSRERAVRKARQGR